MDILGQRYITTDGIQQIFARPSIPPFHIIDKDAKHRVVTVEPDDDLKSVIENSTAGQVIILISGSHIIDQQISWPNHKLCFVGVGNPTIVFDFSSSQSVTTETYPSGTEGTIFQNIKFSTASSYKANFFVDGWIWIDVIFEQCASPVNVHNCLFLRAVFSLASSKAVGGGTYIECVQTNSLLLEFKYTATLLGGSFQDIRLVDYDNIKIVGGEHSHIRLHGWHNPSERDANQIVSIEDVYFSGVTTPFTCESSGQLRRILVRGCYVVRDGVVFDNTSSGITIGDLIFADNYFAASSSNLNILSNSGTIQHCAVIRNSGNAVLDTSQANECEFDMNTGITIS